jgi:hypothetical protein
MFKFLGRLWSFISIGLFIIFLTAVLIWPQASRTLSPAVLFFGIGMTIYLTARSDWKRYQRKELIRHQFTRIITIKMIGLLLALAAAILAGGWTGRLAGQSAWDAGWPEWAVVVAGILAGFAAGFAAGGLVRFLWGKLFGPKRVKTAQAGEGEEFPGSDGRGKSEDCLYPRSCG